MFNEKNRENSCASVEEVNNERLYILSEQDLQRIRATRSEDTVEMPHLSDEAVEKIGKLCEAL